MKKKIKGIAREALKFVLEVSASSYPKEFAGMLYETNQIITHVDVPITHSSSVSAVMDLFTLPVNPHLVGSVHSHPPEYSHHRMLILRCSCKTGIIT